MKKIFALFIVLFTIGGLKAIAQSLVKLKQIENIDSVINVVAFGAIPNDTTDDYDAFQRAINFAAARGKKVVIPAGVYKISQTIIIDTANARSQNGVTIEGLSSYRNVQLHYSGDGYCISVLGSGDEGANPITRFTLRNIYINGNNNTVSKGGINLRRVYIARIENCASVNWANTSANALVIRNAFNIEIVGGNYSNGFPDAQGGAVVEVGSENPEPWNTSNIQFRNTLIQRGQYGILVRHDNNILDNLYIENVSFGSNDSASFYCKSSNVNNISIINSHFENCSNGNHVDIDLSQNVVINNCEFKDAKTHINLHRVNSFEILPQKIYETGNYSIDGSTAIRVTGTSTSYATGQISWQNIYSNQIDTAFSIGSFTRVKMPDDSPTETQWNARYANAVKTFKNSIIKRTELFSGTGRVDSSFQRVWTTPDGVNWYRIVVSERGIGWAATKPSAGPYTAGDVVLNRNPTISGLTGNRYVVAGWNRITTGSEHTSGVDWTEKREYFEHTNIFSLFDTIATNGSDSVFAVTHNLNISGYQIAIMPTSPMPEFFVSSKGANQFLINFKQPPAAGTVTIDYVIFKQ